MLDDEMFKRECQAFEVIARRVREMLAEGYEVRFFDNVPKLEFDILFVGPPEEKGARSDIQKMVMPYEFMHFLVQDDPETMGEMRRRVTAVNQACHELYSFMMLMVTKKLEVEKYGRRHDGKEFKA